MTFKEYLKEAVKDDEKLKKLFDIDDLDDLGTSEISKYISKKLKLTSKLPTDDEIAKFLAHWTKFKPFIRGEDRSDDVIGDFFGDHKLDNEEWFDNNGNLLKDKKQIVQKAIKNIKEV